MKNIRSISTAALPIVLLLSTTASHGISFNSVVSASKGGLSIAKDFVVKQGSTVIKTVAAHPYIAAATVATPVVGFGLYKAGKYAFGKKAADLDLISVEGGNLDAGSANKLLAQIEKEQKETQKALNPTLEKQANIVLTTVRTIANNNVGLKAAVNEAQAKQIANVLKPLLESFKILPDSDVKNATGNFIEVVGAWAKSGTNDIKPILAAIKVLKKANINPAYKPTVAQKAYLALPSKKTVLIGAAVVAIPAAIYAYKNGYLDGAIKAGSNLFNTAANTFKNFTGFGKAVAPVITEVANKATEAVTPVAAEVIAPALPPVTTQVVDQVANVVAPVITEAADAVIEKVKIS
jgi:hypothetical protein